MPKFKTILIRPLLLGTVVFLTGCVAVYDRGGVDSLSNLQKLGKKSYRFRTASNIKKNTIRTQMIREGALSIGAQAGLAWQYRNINAALDENAKMLDNVFNFHALLMPHNVMPPVLLEGQHALRQESNGLLRLSDRTYKIKQQARFVTAPPNWRQYVAQTFPKPELPPQNMLPKNSAEQKVWSEGVKQGWQDGLGQAVEIFNSNLARLVEDYRGMIVYRKLLAQGMVTPPYVAKTELGVTGDLEQLNVNDQVLRIAVLPSMQTNSKRWNPSVSLMALPKISNNGGKLMRAKKPNQVDEKPIVITQRLITKK